MSEDEARRFAHRYMGAAPKCRDCGSTDVEWRQAKSGKWYLAEVRPGARGSVVSYGPHFKSCPASAANQARDKAVLDDEAARRVQTREEMKLREWDGSRYVDKRTGEEWGV